MDSSLIYRKTASGEAALRQRTRGAQRSLRMLLILVNGKETVADLCAKTADRPMTESALRELEQGGFIESMAPGQPGEAAVPDAGGGILEPAMPLPSLAAEEKKAAPTLAWRARLAALWPASKTREADEDFSIRTMRGAGKRYFIGWPMALFFGVSGLAALLLLALHFFPYASYLPEVEAALAQLSGRPAKIGHMQVSFYPKPGLLLGNVSLGRSIDGTEIRISEVRLLPVLATLMSAQKVFDAVELHGATLPAEALAGLFDDAVRPSARAKVLHLTLEQAVVSFHGLAVSGLNGEVRLAPDGRFDSLALHSADRTLTIEAKPAAESIAFTLEAYGWHPSPASPVVVDSGSAKGSLNGVALSLDSIELRILDGLVLGAARLRSDQRPGMAGEISFERISARRLGEALGIGPQFEGETAGKLKFSATADSWSSIFSALDAEGDFTVRRGVLGAIDLAEAARRGSAAPTQGGSTRFEQLSGRLALTPDSSRFSGLVLNSGLLRSVGQLSVGSDLQVSGSMEVQMRGTVNQLRMPVAISGPLKAPLLQAGRR